jgi:transcriptional regulator with XRE-family HTH domain
VSYERRRRFGAHLARLRADAGLSQRELAAGLCRVSGVTSVTRNEISRWERGDRVPDTWLPALADVLGMPLADLEGDAAYARGDIGAALPTPLANLAELLPDEGEELEPMRSDPGRRVVGFDGVAGLAARVQALRHADDVLAAGELIGPAFRELEAAVNLFRESSHVDEVGRALLVQIGELAQIAGWIASDSGRHAQAETAYRLGAGAARQAGDAQLVTHVVGSLAYQMSNTGRAQDGADLVEAVVTEAGPDIHPTARALAYDRLAWARTRAGEVQPAMRALGLAHEALAQAGADEAAPSWAYWVTDDELDVMDARVYTELHRPLRAVPLLTDVLDRYDTTHARELALYLSWLAVALADANEPEEAAAVAERMLALNVASERAAARARVVLRHLESFNDVPEVTALLSSNPPR